jgi:hypothetical protein
MDDPTTYITPSAALKVTTDPMSFYGDKYKVQKVSSRSLAFNLPFRTNRCNRFSRIMGPSFQVRQAPSGIRSMVYYGSMVGFLIALRGTTALTDVTLRISKYGSSFV